MAPVEARDVDAPMRIGVDPRLELIMAVQSASQWRDLGLFRASYPYRDAVFSLVEQHAGHAAVVMYRRLLAEGFASDAPVTFALSHTDLPAFTPRVDDATLRRLTRPHLNPLHLWQFGEALRAFAQETDFLGFLEQWRPMHEQLAMEAGSVVDPSWAARLHGYSGGPRRAIHICLAPLSRGSYGPTIPLADGAVSYVVVGADTRTKPRFPQFEDRQRMEDLVLHEGAHGFVNQAIDASGEAWDASVGLYGLVAGAMAPLGYANWRITVCEHVVRAAVARLRHDTESCLLAEERLGFRYVRIMAEALRDYEGRRDIFPDFWAFAPRLAARMADVRSAHALPWDIAETLTRWLTGPEGRSAIAVSQAPGNGEAEDWWQTVPLRIIDCVREEVADRAFAVLGVEGTDVLAVAQVDMATSPPQIVSVV